MVLLDERRQVTAMFADPPTELGLFVGWCDEPGLEVPFSQTMMICLAHHVANAAPDPKDRIGYFELRRIHMLQGLQLLDVLMVDHERVQSLAIACDPTRCGSRSSHRWRRPRRALCHAPRTMEVETLTMTG